MSIVYNRAESIGSKAILGKDIKKCYLKRIVNRSDQKNITKKTHHHTSFEIHIVTKGYQKYRVGDKTFTVTKGEFLLIHPGIDHAFLSCSEEAEKFSITFYIDNSGVGDCLFSKTPDRVIKNIEFICEESANKKEISSVLIENSLFETIILFLRLTGMKEKSSTGEIGENAALAISKQFIGDNIERVFTVHDVSKFCYLSSKQLTRIFKKYENMSPGAYIINRRIEKIEELLSDTSMSLKDISEKMNFTNEYYFNSFFKKYAGMPPGTYRKMVEK